MPCPNTSPTHAINQKDTPSTSLNIDRRLMSKESECSSNQLVIFNTATVPDATLVHRSFHNQHLASSCVASLISSWVWWRVCFARVA
jgi:hypothetical protein